MRRRARIALLGGMLPVLAMATYLGTAQAAATLPPVSATDLGVVMQQRLDLGGVIVYVPQQDLHPAPSGVPSGPPLPGGPPTAHPTQGPQAPGGAPPHAAPGPRLPVVRPGAGNGPTRGLLAPLDRGAQADHGMPVLYTVLSGPTAELAGINPATGDAYGTPVPLPGIQGSWSLVRGNNGDVYIGGYLTGDLYQYDPTTGQVRNLGNPTGDNYIFSLSVDPVTGIVYGGTWPSGDLFSYNPATGRFGPTVTVAPGETYARSVAAYNNHVYIGLGDAKPELADYNALTGSTTMIPLPPQDQGKAGTVGTVQVVAPDRLYVQFLGGLIYSIPNDRLVSTFGEPSGSAVSQETLGPNLYFVQRDTNKQSTSYGEGWIQTYNLATNTEQTYTSPSASYAPYLWGDQPHEVWPIHLHTPGFPGISMVTLDARAHLTAFDLANGAFSYSTLTNLPGQPEDIETLGPGPGGTSDLIGSGYLQGDSFTYTPATGSVENAGPGQAEGIASTGGDVYFGTYPGGAIWRYDPAKAWLFGPSPLLQQNPAPVTILGHNQIRPFVLTPDGQGGLVVGSVPSYGEFGGLLATVDGLTGATTPLYPLPSPVTRQAPVAAAPLGNGNVVIGTTVSGGTLGTPPVPPSIDPNVFTYDAPAAQAATGSFLGSPFANQWAIDGLTYDASTRLVYGLTPTFLFAYDPATGQITQTQTITQATPPPTSAATRYYDWGHSSGIVAGSNGELYALDSRAQGAILEVDPSTLAYRIVATGASRIGADPAGDVYFSKGPDLWSLTPQS